MKPEKSKKTHNSTEISEADRKKRARAIKLISISLAALALLSVVGYIAIRSLLGGENGFSEIFILAKENPIAASIVLFLVTVVQVVIAFIPGELVEQACGVLGPYIGTLISFLGAIAGSICVLLIVRRFGRGLVYAIYPKEKIESISFLQDHKKRNFLVFTLFFIPGTPKDILTYAIGLTDMSIPLYLALTSIARMPSIIVSTISGDWISDIAIGGGGIMKVIILNAVSLLLCAVGYLIYMLINKKHAAKKEQKSKENVE